MSIKLKSFSMEKTEEANKFMLENPPRSTEKQSGMIFHSGHIVIIYDDGKENPKEREGMLKGLLEGERQKKALTFHKLTMAQLALDRIKPVKYVLFMSDTRLNKLLEEQGMNNYEERKAIVNEIANLENEIKMDSHEIKRMDYEIEAYQLELKNK